MRRMNASDSGPTRACDLGNIVGDTARQSGLWFTICLRRPIKGLNSSLCQGVEAREQALNTKVREIMTIEPMSVSATTSDILRYVEGLG